MPDVWLEMHPPRDVQPEQLTAMLRTLASRPRLGFARRTPVVVFEAWATGGTVCWLLGMEQVLVGTVPPALTAQMPGLVFAACDDRPAHRLQLVADIRLTSAANPLRTDTAESVSAGVLHTLGQVRGNETAAIQWCIGTAQNRKAPPADFRPAQALGWQTPAESYPGAQQAFRQKVAEPLFAIRGRLGVQADATRSTILLRSLAGALSAANGTHAEVRVSRPSARKVQAFHEGYHSGASWSGIANAQEIGLVLGWPLAGVATPGRPPVPGRPPRQLLRTASELAHAPQRVAGISLHPADKGKLVVIPQETVRKNLHYIGPTGSGKSTALAHQVLADVAAGHGVVVIEPRGDLVADILARLPKHRHDDLVLVDPAERDQVGMNPLAGNKEDAERRADELTGLFRAEYGSAIGARSTDVLLHAALTAARLDGGTLADIPVLLSSPAFRRRVLPKVADPLVLSPWWAAFEGRSEAERQQIVAPIKNKLSAFLSRTPIRRMLSQGNPKFSFDDAFTDRPKVVLVNLNSGVIGAEASRLLGALILQTIWQAMQRRALLPQAKRFPVNLIIDEFQGYVGALDMGDVLAQIRGLGGSLTIAHQLTAQLSADLRAAVAANARSRIAFQPSQDDAKALAALLGVQPDDLLALGAFQACARLLVNDSLTDAFGVQGLPLPPPSTNPDALRRRSRRLYAVDGEALDESLRERWEGGGTARGGQIGVKKRRAS